MTKCVDCGYKLTEYYPPGAARCARCAHIARGLSCCLCHKNKQVPFYRYCKPCVDGISRAYKESGKQQARTAIQKALKTKLLPAARTFQCVDCGKQARGYDHRDYSKPLEVVPVCGRCNKLRGHADNLAALIKMYCLPEERAS